MFILTYKIEKGWKISLYLCLYIWTCNKLERKLLKGMGLHFPILHKYTVDTCNIKSAIIELSTTYNKNKTVIIDMCDNIALWLSL